LFLILFGIILFLYNNIEGFSIGGLNFRLYKINENFQLVNVDMGGGIGGDHELINSGTMDQQTFDTIQTELQRNPSMDPRYTHPEVFSNIDRMESSYQLHRSELTRQLDEEGLNDKVIDKILDVYFKKYFESLKEYFKLEKQLCSATYTSTFEDELSTYDLDVLFGERDPYTMSPLNDRLLSLDTDLFRKIFREKLITVNLDYSFVFNELLEFLHQYRDYYGFSGSSDEDSDDEESEEYLTEQEFVNIFSLFIAVLLSRGYELRILMEFIRDELDTEIPDILHSYHRNDYITISEIIIRIFLRQNY